MRAERGGGNGGKVVPHLRCLDRPGRSHHVLLLLLRAEALLQTAEDGRVGGDEKKRVSDDQVRVSNDFTDGYKDTHVQGCLEIFQLYVKRMGESHHTSGPLMPWA